MAGSGQARRDTVAECGVIARGARGATATADRIEELEVPDPNSPNELGKTMTLEIFVGYIVEASVAGGSGSETSGFVDDSVTGLVQLVR